MLLTLLCVVYDEFQDFPKKRHALYGEALDVLLRKWASEKRIQRNPIYQELSAELELDMLAEIAYTSFVDNQLFFSKDRLISQIREFLVDNLNAPRHLDAETVLKEIEIQQGILVERARDAYSFSHLTFQEYLTAKCILDNNKVEQLVCDHVTKQHWREVFLLVAGLAPGKRGADELLLTMERQAQTYVSAPKLKSLLAWATVATEGSPGASKAAAKRTLAVFLARARTRARASALDRTLDLDRALALASALDLDLDRTLACDLALDHDHARALALDLALDLDLACDLAKEYQKLGVFKKILIDELILDLERLKSLIPDEKDSLERRGKFIQKIRFCFPNKLRIDPVNLLFHYEEMQQLENYYYILELMIRCKEAAVRVSPQVWEGIESRMVTVPD